VLLPAVLFNSPQIFEKIFGDELIMDVIGSLECKFSLFVGLEHFGSNPLHV